MVENKNTIGGLSKEISSKFDEYKKLANDIEICIGKPSFARCLKEKKEEMRKLHGECRRLEEELTYKLSNEKYNTSRAYHEARDILSQAREIFIYAQI